MMATWGEDNLLDGLTSFSLPFNFNNLYPTLNKLFHRMFVVFSKMILSYKYSFNILFHLLLCWSFLCHCSSEIVMFMPVYTY